MAVNWSTVGTQIEAAVRGIVGPAWAGASAGASTQFQAILAAGQLIESNREGFGTDDYNSLKIMQERALEGVLQTYEGIAINVAQQAAAAAWGVVALALKTAYPALVFL